MTWLARWIEQLGGTAKATVIAGIAVFVGIALGVGLGALTSLAWSLLGHPALEPTPGWRDAMDSLLIAAGAFAGVGVVGVVGKRAATRADVVREQSMAITRGQNPPPGADPDEGTYTEPPIGGLPVAAPVDGRTKASDDPARGLADDGEPL